MTKLFFDDEEGVAFSDYPTFLAPEVLKGDDNDENAGCFRSRAGRLCSKKSYTIEDEQQSNCSSHPVAIKKTSVASVGSNSSHSSVEGAESKIDLWSLGVLMLYCLRVRQNFLMHRMLLIFIYRETCHLTLVARLSSLIQIGLQMLTPSCPKERSSRSRDSSSNCSGSTPGSASAFSPCSTVAPCRGSPNSGSASPAHTPCPARPR